MTVQSGGTHKTSLSTNMFKRNEKLSSQILTAQNSVSGLASTHQRQGSGTQQQQQLYSVP